MLRLLAADVLRTEDPRTVRIDRTCLECGGNHARPVLADAPQLAVSITHGGAYVGLAVGLVDGIGIDVEPVGVAAGSMPLESVLSRWERSELCAGGSIDQEAVLLTYWTRKEAILKATGRGLRTSPVDLTVSPPEEAPVLLHWGANADVVPTIDLAPLTLPRRHIAHVATLGRLGRVHELCASRLLRSAHPDRRHVRSHMPMRRFRRGS